MKGGGKVVKIGNLTVNPYEVDDFIIYDEGDTCQAIIRFRSGSEEVAFEGTVEQCTSLFKSDLCKRISNLITERQVRQARARVFEG